MIVWLRGRYQINNLGGEKITGAEAVFLARQAFALEHGLGLDQVTGRRAPGGCVACVGYRWQER